jgi:2-polyprenyl-3-methyl-5-hydroxy-6-metoxy-1,4-benzoquinol methylase
MYEDSIREEFTHQSRSFGVSSAMTSAETLGALIEAVPQDPSADWIDLACGPGVISRATAARVGSVTGVDLTPAMIEEAERRASEEGIDNVGFAVGDVTALDFDEDSFDGAITRLSLHHIPAPGRVVAEMARLVRPGGWALVSDIVADQDRDANAWREEIERLRDPSHWACHTSESLGAMAESAGLILEEEKLIPIEIDFDDWLERGSGGASAAGLVARLLREQPAAAESFSVTESAEGRRLHQHYWLGRWRVPA